MPDWVQVEFLHPNTSYPALSHKILNSRQLQSTAARSPRQLRQPAAADLATSWGSDLLPGGGTDRRAKEHSFDATEAPQPASLRRWRPLQSVGHRLQVPRSVSLGIKVARSTGGARVKVGRKSSCSPMCMCARICRLPDKEATATRVSQSD
jgi:hypothetical protein